MSESNLVQNIDQLKNLPKTWVIRDFAKIVSDNSGGNKKLAKTEFLESGEIAIVDQGKELIAGYYNNLTFLVKTKPPYIVFGDHTRIFKFIDFPFIMGADGTKVLQPKDNNCSTKFLYYFFLSINIPETGYNRHFKYLKELQIPLPPLEQQKKIASILDAADAYRQRTKALIAKYDELTQSLFLDMFGDPVKNEKGWEKIRASNYYEVRGRVGWKGYKKTDLRDKGAIVLGATHVNSSGELDLTKVVYLSNEKFEESPEIVVKLNDLIFVQRGNTIGKIGLVRKDLGKVTINPVVLIFRPIGSNPLFLLYLLMNKELNREFVNSNSGSAQPMITQKFMKDFLLIKIPINLQNQFAERVQAIEVQKSQAKTSLEKAEELFNSLLQRAFKGELV
jgi:type I restriction enzyme S subunit